jgi:hypothetical protein
MIDLISSVNSLQTNEVKKRVLQDFVSNYDVDVYLSSSNTLKIGFENANFFIPLNLCCVLSYSNVLFICGYTGHQSFEIKLLG